MNVNRNALPSLIVITDWELGRDVLLRRVRAAASLGPRVAVQHRHPGATARAFLEEARLLQEVCAAEGNPLFINGRLDVALAVGAHLHLPARTLAVADVRRHLAPEQWVSMAVHDETEAAESQGAELVLVSPVFGPGSKPGDTRPQLGPEGFARLAAKCSAPAYALGGIDARTAADVSEARGYAVISAVLHTDDARASALRLLTRGATVVA